jgi:hypothetical protein|tara:strand:- start:172 stop:378 length:207 start_codon:yes stop_codon:yes gene_type:complete
MDIGLAILMGIAVLLIMIYLSTRSIVEVLNHWGRRADEYQKRNGDAQGHIMDKLDSVNKQLRDNLPMR